MNIKITLATLTITLCISTSTAWGSGNLADLIATHKASGFYTGELTEVNGIPLPPKFFQFIEALHPDGTFSLLVWLPDPIAPPGFLEYSQLGEWAVTDTSKNAINIKFANRTLISDPFGIFVPGGGCANGCIEAGLVASKVSKDGNSNGMGSSIYIDYFTGEPVPGAVTHYKLTSQKIDLIHAHETLFQSTGVEVPEVD